MSEKTKTPQAKQWWVNSSGKIRYIIGVKLCGSIVYEDSTGWSFANGHRDWSDWRHEPRCTGFDWTEPPAIDPGEGWELLPVGTVREREDEFTRDAGKTWKCTKCYGERIPSDSLLTFRRRKPTADVWPKYVVCDTWLVDAYIRRDSETVSHGIKSDGKPFRNPYEWSEFQDGLILQGKWRYVTEAEALARVVKPTEHDSDPPPFAKPFTSARSGMGIRKDAVAWRPNGQRHEVATDVTYQAETCVESPYEWVIQDSVTARTGIDRGWWGTTLCPEHDKWWIVCDNGSASGKKHGYVNSDGIALNLICRRKDLPAVPATIEETFPQWYILKESEWQHGITPWAIKRTGEETSIRYAYDGGDKLLASNETWYGATDVWRKCHSAEAFQRLGILGEAYLPAVPADKRRVPIKAWVTYRLADEGGDWPVRATPADQTYQNWKEIKFDSNGMFIEVDK